MVVARVFRKNRNSYRNRFRMFKRKWLYPVWREIEWPLVGGFGVVSIILGYTGFSRVSATVGEESTAWDLLYRTLQLIVFQSGDISGDVPWQLEISRFLIPAVAAYAAIQALLAISSEQWQLLRARFIRRHIVVCGLGERGLKFSQEGLDHGYQVMLLEENEENPLIDRCRGQGAIVLIGDATDKNLLRKAKINEAKYLICVCSDDGVNAEIALKTRDLIQAGKNEALTAFVHIVDLELCNSLRSWGLSAGKKGSFKLEFFNVLERGAKLMLEEYSSFFEKAFEEDRQPRMLIVGLGKMGRSLVRQAARTWWFKQEDRRNLLRISVIDKDAEAKMELLRLRDPQLDTICEFDIRQMERNAPEFERGDFLFDSCGRCNIDIIFICFDDDVHVLASALTLLGKVRKYRIPIVMRMSQDAGFAALMKEDREAFDIDQLHVFSLLDRTCSLKELLGGMHEILAQAIHEKYVHHRKQAGDLLETNPSIVEWDDLPEDLKDSNRHQAAHIKDKLKAVGYGIQNMITWETCDFKFSPEEVEKLAEIEHDRWCEERRKLNWSYTPGNKDIKKKINPHLVPWAELSEEIKEYDRNMVRGLPNFLTRAGFQIYRKT